ncbi:MAG: cytochrome c [Planctomycetes bacterium]|nr:cytochrome c [Planctomycetota bacterium]
MDNHPPSRHSFAVLTLSCALMACSSQSARRSTQTSTEGTQVVAAAMPKANGSAYEAADRVHLPKVEPEDHPSLHNVFALSKNIISGSEPHGEEAFAILKAKGIRTILSVDGKVPNAEMAARYGMRYVHVPIQYKGMNEDEVTKISKTFRELPGPFYVHCFHGKHRGPAAAALGRLVVDGLGREQAIAEMRQWCGTSKSYEGLYETIARTEVPDATITEALDFEFPAAHPLDGVPGSMVPIVRANDHLKDLAKRDFETDPAHPDVDALHEAGKIASLFEQASKLDSSDYGDDFRQWMQDAVRHSGELRDELQKMKDGAGDVEAAKRAFSGVAASCKACHGVYRN